MTDPGTPPPAIRPARASDDTVLGELDRATWSTLHSVQPRPMPPYGPFFDEKHPPEGYLVAEVNTMDKANKRDGELRVAGYVRVVPPSSLACNQHVRQIQGISVADWARGRGVGRALLRAAADEARRQGAVRITLRVLGHNTPARRLYESEGYVVEGVLPGELFLAGRYVDDVLMGRSL
ncbi:GNAT family N-acetyltransferase [Streptomyces formicae]|uniref:GNAT family N-acetyltransferase n=1 Tax=Streptomyces formicae TaxID=1616117 RepID=A0ABY3WW04_9ACTN|nr:GNAT family N-acetyltransferase [Streptomyces formicae]UNM14661.1 GNAT family N-acetyltransferase [Streptomyces formicae]